MNKLFLIILLLLAASAVADPAITVDIFEIDRSTSRSYNPIAIPRNQMVGLSDSGDVAIMMAGPFPTSSYTFYVTKNLDSSVIWPIKKTESPTFLAHDHGHLSVYSDTIYWGVAEHYQMRMYSWTGAALNYLAGWNTSYSTTGDQKVQSIMRLPGSDSVIAISRGETEPGSTNILWYLSTDKGVNYTLKGLAVDYTSVGSDIRIGLFHYDNSIAIVTDTAHSGADSKGGGIYKYNRATGAFDAVGQPISTSSGGFRCFGANAYNDTTIYAWHAKDDIGGSANDSVIVAHKNKGAGSWTREAIFVGSGTDMSGATPYFAVTEIQRTHRLVAFQNFHTGTTTDLFFRYLKSDGTWSDTTRITNNGVTWKFGTMEKVPASHGDVAYVSYPFDTVISGTTYHMGKIARITFLEPSSTVVMSSFPFTITDDNKTYLLEADGTSATYGILFDNSSNSTIENIVIDGQGHNLTFGTAGTAHSGSSPEISDVGVYMAGKSINNMIVQNVNFLHNPPNSERDSTNECWAMAVRWGASVRNSKFKNCTFKVVGRQSKISWAAGGDLQYNNDFEDCVFIDSCHAWERRDYWVEQAMMVFWGHNTIPTPADFQYHFRIKGCSTAVAFWNNLYIESDSGVFDIDDNAWYSDGWNSLYGILQLPSAQNNMTTATENYPIALRADNVVAQGNRIKFHNNRVRSGTAHSGSRGIFISGVESVNWNFDDSSVAIYDNTFDIHNGFDGYVGYTIGVIVRDAWKGIRIHDNIFDIPNYHTPPNGSYSDGPSCGLRLTANPGENLYFRHNTVSCYFVDAFTWDETNGDAGEQASIVHADENEMNSSNLWIDSNTFITNNIFFDLGYGNGNGGNFQTIGNRFEWYGGSYSSGSDKWVWYSGNVWTNTRNAYGNYLQDSYFDDGIPETKLYVGDEEADSLSIGLKATTTITVVNGSAVPVPGAAVTVTDGYGHLIASGTTDANGVYAPVVKYYELFNDTWSNPDSTGFNPFVFHASYSGDTDDSTFTVAWNTKTITLTLTEAEPPPDVTPPSPIVIRGGKFKGGVYGIPEE